MKEILAKKRKLKEHETIKLNEECSSILHNKLVFLYLALLKILNSIIFYVILEQV